jgi:energy-coupling factor transporter ATP-binding protein EcfA2
MESVIRARNLRYRYPDGTPALRGVDFELSPGQTVMLLGPNGSGKTTFTLHLNGLLKGEGQLQVLGREIERWNLKELRREIGMVFQSSDEQLFMPSVLDDVMFGLVNSGVGHKLAQEKARAALVQCGYYGDLHKSPQRLSAGEKRRVALAGVLVTEPRVLVLDEPTVYLDPPSRHELTLLLQALPQPKVVITHDTDFALAAGTDAVFFHDGVIRNAGPVRSVLLQNNWHFLADTLPESDRTGA